MRHAAVGKCRDGHRRQVESERLTADYRNRDAEQRFRDRELDFVQRSNDEVDRFHTDGRNLLQEAYDAQNHRLYHRKHLAYQIHRHLDGVDQSCAHQADHRGQQWHDCRDALIHDKAEDFSQHRLDVVHSQIHDLREHTGKRFNQRHNRLDGRGHSAEHVTQVQPSDTETG